MIGHGRCRAFAVAAGDTNDSAIALIPVGQFDLGDHGDAVFADAANHVTFIGYAGALHDLVGGQDTGIGMSFFLEGDAMLGQGFAVGLLQGAAVGDEHVVSALGRQDRCAYATFTST